MRTFCRIVMGIILLSYLCEQKSFALVSTEIGVGQRVTKVKYDLTNETGKTKSISGQEMSGSIMIDPIPLVPISFGLVAMSSSDDRSKLSKEILEDSSSQLESLTLDSLDSKSKVSRLMYGPVFKVWAPTPYVKPYLKFAYLVGQEVETNKTSASFSGAATVAIAADGKETRSVTGSEIAIGFGFSPIKLFNIFYELGMFSGSTKVKSYSAETSATVDSETTTETLDTSSLSDSEKKSKTASAASFRLGVSIGF